MLKKLCFISWMMPLSLLAQTLVGTSKVDITPTDWEARPLNPDSPKYKWRDPFYDTGIDRLYDFEEAGAFGPDRKPGMAGVDDDRNGIIDDCTREHCDEYLAVDSDDIVDAAGDNFDKKTNPTGTQNDGKFQFLHLAGFAPKYPFFMANRYAVGVHDPIWARGLAVTSDQKTLIMIVVDSPGVGLKHINPVRRRLAKKYDIPVDNIIISSTHDHYAPDGMGYWATIQKGHNKHYTDKLREWMFLAGDLAMQTRHAAKMKVVTTSHYACYNPVTKELKKAAHCNIPLTKNEYNESLENQGDEMIVQGDVRDPLVRNTEIVAAQFLTLDTNQTIATFVNWHNHPDSMTSDVVEVSSGYPHYIRKYIENHLGGTALYFVGTLGCQIGGLVRTPKWNESFQREYTDELDIHGNPVPVLVYDTENPFDHIRSTGYEIGHEVVKALEVETKISENIDLSIETQPVDTEVDNFLHNLATWSTWNFDVEEEDQMLHYFPRCTSRHGCIRSDIALVQMGDLSLITGPGEIDPAYYMGRESSEGHYKSWPSKKEYPSMPALKTFMKGPHTAIIGQANNYLSYLLPYSDNLGWWRFFHPNHYEEFPTTHKHFGDDIGNKWMQMLGQDYRYNDRPIYPNDKTSLVEKRGLSKQKKMSRKLWDFFFTKFFKHLDHSERNK